jgi:hypothetical protein
MRDGYCTLKLEAAPGADGVSWKEYETDLVRILVFGRTGLDLESFFPVRP